MVRARGAPPEVPGGWTTGPPDFVGVGAQRAGTSRWFRLIAAHPGVAGRMKKERHYFDRFAHTPFDGDAIRRYHELFPRPAGRIVGEWTPRYMHDFWTPPCLARAAPKAKILVTLRDPIERYRSGLSFGATLARGPEREALTQLANSNLWRSLYFAQLSHLLEHFDRAQLLVLQYERCAEDPVSELHRTYEFLDLDPPDHVPRSIHDQVGGLPWQNAELPGALIASLKDRLADDVTQLARAFPEIDLTLWPHFRPAER